MRISEITNWAYGITVVLTVASGAAFIMAAQSADEERASVQSHLVLDDLSDALALGAEERTDEARLYVISGMDRHLKAFQGDEQNERRLTASIKTLRTAGVLPAETSALDEIERSADALDDIEETAVAKYQGGDQAAATDGLFGAEHERLQTVLLAGVKRLQELVRERTTTAMDLAKLRSDRWGAVAKSMLGITAALFLGVLYFVLKRRVAMPLMRMTGIVTRLARQDYTVEVPVDRRQDEIGDMNHAIKIFRENGIERERLDAERQADQRTKDLILQMMHRLQACQAQDELANVVARFAPQIFPQLAGHLYILNDGRTLLTQAGTWLMPLQTILSFTPGACWGLRRGRPHLSNYGHGDIPCHHIGDTGTSSICVPLTAQGDTIGLLYFEEREGEDMAPESVRLYLELIAENIGLAIANLKLRDRLTNLAVRDALTGLYNRRCLDEAMIRHASEGVAGGLSCLMIDIDRFKRFNDDFGHDAGDLVMQYVSQLMLDTVGEAGHCYRFGGEEFTVLLPGQGEQEARELAEQLRQRIATAPLSHNGRVLGNVTISIGVAQSPTGGPIPTLVTRADSALLAAKAQGRNRSVLASELEFAEDSRNLA